MNRRGIGMAIFAAGAGAAMRRKFGSQIQAGAELADDMPAQAAVSPGPLAPVTGANNAAPTSVDAAPTSVDVEPSTPSETSTPLSSDSLLGQTTEAKAMSSSDLIADLDTALVGPPEGGSPEIGEQELLVEPFEPVSMPVAETIDVAKPDVVEVPKADGSSPVRLTGVSAMSPVAKPVVSSAIPPTSLPTPVLSPSEQASTATAASSFAPTSDRVEHSASPSQTSWARRRYYGWNVFAIALVSLLVIGAITASVVRLPYYRLQPGSVYDTIERVQAPGDLVFVPQGEIGYVTVSQTPNITPWQWLDAQLDENIRLRHEDEVIGDQTADEARANDLRRMQVSKNSAVVVALQKLGYELIITPIGVEVAQVFACAAADGVLGTGDLIVAVNGVPTLDGESLVNELVSIGIDQQIELLVERIDPADPTQSMRTDLVGLTLGSADDPCLDDAVRAEEPRPFIGIGTQTMYDEELPLDIDVRTGAVSGPSAGLAFTLAIMDVLSEGELTNGLNIVATGTIDREGRVGPVGGIHQKTIAAERSGADVFLVPMCCDNFVDRTSGEELNLPSNFEEAQLHADEMIVIGVETIDDALIAIGELGGDVELFLTP